MKWIIGTAVGLSLLAGSQAAAQAPSRALVPGTEAVERVATVDCPLRPATLGVTISSFLGNGSCFGFDPVFGSFYIHTYVFSAISGQTVLVNYSAQFQGAVALLDFYRGTVLADSSACGLASSCSFSYTAPASGQYLMTIKAYGFGTYTLTAAGAAGTCEFAAFVRNQPLNGTISTTGCAGSNPPHYFNAYQFDATAGEVLRLTYTAVTLPSLVLQIDPPNSNWGHTFASGQGSVTLDFAAQTTGTYSLFAQTQNPSETGTYTLLVQSAPASTATTVSLSSRFNVSVAWHTADGRSGAGTANPLSIDTGYFWFFSGTNVELVVKVLDGRPLNGKWWVFYGALSNVQYTITVTDTQTGVVKQYINPQGTLASVADTSAF